jgi:hypothetical protein
VAAVVDLAELILLLVLLVELEEVEQEMVDLELLLVELLAKVIPVAEAAVLHKVLLLIVQVKLVDRVWL